MGERERITPGGTKPGGPSVCYMSLPTESALCSAFYLFFTPVYLECKFRSGSPNLCVLGNPSRGETKMTEDSPRRSASLWTLLRNEGRSKKKIKEQHQVDAPICVAVARLGSEYYFTPSFQEL